MSASVLLRVVPAPAPLSQREALEARRDELRAELAGVESQIAQMASLTDRQREVIVFISNYQVLNEGRSPSLRQIGQAIGVASVEGVRGHLVLLEKKGAIAREAGKRCSIKLLRSF